MIKKGVLILTGVLIGFTSLNAQWNIDKVKNILGAKKEPSKLDNHLQQLVNLGKTKRFTGSDAETKTANYIGETI